MTIMEEIRAAALEQGLLEALWTLIEGPGGGRLVRGPGGHALVPPGVDVDSPTASWLGHVTLGRAELSAIRDPEGPHAPPDWLVGLTHARLGWSEALLGHTLVYLGSRRSGDVTLLQRQLVKAELAEAVTEQVQVATVLDGATAAALNPATVQALHRQLTRADRTLLRLIGGSGYTADGNGQTTYVSELLADIYIGGVAT